MIIEFEVNGARVIVTGENLSVSVSEDNGGRSAKIPAPARAFPSGLEIKALRKSMGLRQHAFSKLFGVDQSTVSRWETGTERPSGPAAILLSDLIKASAAPAQESAA